MRKALWTLVILPIFALPLFAAWLDQKANSEARKRWGSLAWIGRGRTANATNWTLMVGIDTRGCASQYSRRILPAPVGVTILGAAEADYQKAFADVDAHPPEIAGPFSGYLDLVGSAADDTAVAGFMWVIDNVDLWQEYYRQEEAPRWEITTELDTRELADGLHIICARVIDQAGNIGTGGAAIFRVDQSLEESPAAWQPSSPPFSQARSGFLPALGKIFFGS